ncbi:MAG: DNA primase [Bacteroidales bacterium]|nr:DNA primase [Bacteroidales bacterium]
MIERSVIDNIVETANSNIVDIISDYVSLKKRGANYIGCCPFHNEKTGSFTVSPAKGIYKCFGCGKAGNALNFVIDHDHLTFVEAIKVLGKRVGIEVKERELTPEMKEAQTKRESLSAVMEYAQQKFVSNLWDTDEGQSVGMTYFRHRGFTDFTIKEFGLGYSMQQRDALTVAALNAGYKKEYLTETGLSIFGENNYQADRFWGRVMFPIHSISGKIIAFGGRVMQTSAKTAKYLNSPEYELYHKSDVVYGIYQAKNEIIRQDRCYLVEGYTDVISMHQSGITNVIASCGTSLTQNQIKLIQRFTNNMTVLYDGDYAGIKASLRGIDMILKEGMNVKVLLLPDGEDPDSFALKHTAEDFVAYINTHQTDFIQFKASILLKDAENEPLKKSAAVNSIVDSISVVQDLILREYYVKECAKLMDIREDVIYSVLTNKVVADAQRAANDKFNQNARQNLAVQQANARATLANTTGQQPESANGVQSGLEQAANTIALQQQMEAADYFNPYMREEREVLRYFLKYMHYALTVDGKDSTVGAYVKESLDEDQYKSVDPVFNRIMAFYEQKPDATINNYTNSSDSEMVTRVIDLISDEFSLSKMHRRFGKVEPEESKIGDLVPKTVAQLRFKFVKEKINELSQAIESCSDSAKQEELLEEYANWHAVKKNLSESLDNRIF